MAFRPSQTAGTFMPATPVLPLLRHRCCLSRRDSQIGQRCFNYVLEGRRGDDRAPGCPLRLVDLDEDGQDGIVEWGNAEERGDVGVGLVSAAVHRQVGCSRLASDLIALY